MLFTSKLNERAAPICENTGKNLVQNFIQPKQRNAVVSVLRDALSGKERANFELTLFTKDGVSVDLLLNATTRRDAKGDVSPSSAHKLSHSDN